MDTRISPQGSHTESSFSAKCWPFELSLKFWIEIDIGYNILENDKNYAILGVNLKAYFKDTIFLVFFYLDLRFPF